MMWRPDHACALSGSADMTPRVWNVKTGRCEHVLRGHVAGVHGLAISPHQHYTLSGSHDKTIRLWDFEAGRCRHVFEGHASQVSTLAWTVDHRCILSGSFDNTLRLWNVETGGCVRVFEGHTRGINGVATSADSRCALSGAADNTVRLWDMEAGHCVHVLKGHTESGSCVALSADSRYGLSSGDDKTVWLWDFGGQADQRLIHQLYMDQTQVAALVFDPQKDGVFETLGQWDRDLSRADEDKDERSRMTKLLVAGRCDTGSLRVARKQVEDFAAERGYEAYLETSAKKSTGCEELKQAIIDGIRWENIPWRSSPVLFKRLEDEIVKLKSGDSYLTMRKRDKAEIFKIPEQRHATYWMNHESPVLLIHRSSQGIVRWMEVRDHLKKITNNGEKQVRQIEFEGKRFDVMSVRRWRDSALDCRNARS